MSVQWDNEWKMWATAREPQATDTYRKYLITRLKIVMAARCDPCATKQKETEE